MPKGIKNSAPECLIGECEYSAVARGLCSTHYQRWKTHGDPTATNRNARNRVCGGTELQKFWAKVEVSHGCWLWQGGLSSGGYGRFKLSDGTGVIASRWLYQALNGPLDDDTDVCHTCDNTTCVNPAHLWAGSPSANALDSVHKGRHTSQVYERAIYQSECYVDDCERRVFAREMCYRHYMRWRRHERK